MKPTKPSEIQISSDATGSIDDDGLAILDLRRGRLFRSNSTGALIWHCIECQLGREAIAEKICHQYRIALEAAREHTARFLGELECQNLLVVRAEA